MNDPSKIASAGLIMAFGYILDILLEHKKPHVYDKFLRWWYWLSNLNLGDFVKSCVGGVARGGDIVFGEKIFSIKATIIGVLFAILVAVGVFASILFPVPGNIMVRTIVLCLLIFPVIIPSLIVLMLVRVLLRVIRRKPTFFAIAGICALIAVITVFCFAVFCYAFGVASNYWIATAFAHSIDAGDTISVLAGSYSLFVAFGRLYAYCISFPVIFLAANVLFWLVIYLVSSLCFFVREFLRLQVEKNSSKPFVEIGTCVVALLALGNFASEYIPTGAIKHFQDYESTFALEIIMAGAQIGQQPSTVKYALYDAECSAGLIGIMAIGPRPEYLKSLYYSSLPRIVKKWSKVE